LIWGCTAVVSCGRQLPIKDTLIDRGILTSEQTDRAEKALKVGTAFRKSFADLTEEEEYYIGRSVAAHILSKYDLYHKIARARASAYLDTREIVAFAAPGGFVFISRGMISSIKNEEELAGVLAHEVTHISERHGLKAIKQSRLVEAFSILAKEVKSEAEVQKLTQHFEGVLKDIIKTLMEKGYSRE
jgi:predicted Zn-dependent protease